MRASTVFGPGLLTLCVAFGSFGCSGGNDSDKGGGVEKDGGGGVEKDGGAGVKKDAGGSSKTDGGQVQGQKDAGGAVNGSCPSKSEWVYSDEQTLAGGTLVVGCTGSYAPMPPSGFMKGHCPSSGLSGCCVGTGPCGMTGQCYYNLPSEETSTFQSSCASNGDSWQADPL